MSREGVQSVASGRGMSVTTDDDRRVLRELSDGIREAFVADRLAELMARRLEGTVSREIHDVLGACLSRELRAALHGAAAGGVDTRRATALLNNRPSDALGERLRVVLTEMFPSILRERLPSVMRAAIAGSEFAAERGQTAVDALVDRLLCLTENAIRQRMDDGFRDVVRIRIGEAARNRVGDAMRTAATRRSHDGDADHVAASLGEEIEAAVHDRVVRGVLERFRAVVRNSLLEATADRLRDAVQYAMRGADTNAERRPGVEGRSSAGQLDHLASAIEKPIAEEVIGRVANGLRDRLDATVRRNLDAVLHERLPVAIRLAVVEQAHADVVDLERLATMIEYELAEIIHDRICDGVRARTAEAVQAQLGQAVRTGIARGSSARGTRATRATRAD